MSMDPLINNCYSKKEKLESLRAWFYAEVATPIGLKQFLGTETALSLSRMLMEIANWQRSFSIISTSGEVIETTEMDWLETPQNRRWNRHDISYPGDQMKNWAHFSEEGKRILREFVVYFLGADGIKVWLSEITGKAMGKATCEVVRYNKGDFLAPHSDTHDSRCIGMNLYLDSEWRESDGGALVYENDSGGRTTIVPEFNSASVFPVRVGCMHWVSPWTSARCGRYAISLSYAAAE